MDDYNGSEWFDTSDYALGDPVTFVVQVAVERRTDIAGGGALRLACALVLAAGVVSSSRRTHRIVTVAMLVVLVSGAALVSVRLMQ